jgi:hypothetical protein
MSERLQFIIFMAFGAFCFASGVLAAFIVTRNKWRDEMIKRGVARYNSRTGKWEWGGTAERTRDVESAVRRSGSR